MSQYLYTYICLGESQKTNDVSKWNIFSENILELLRSQSEVCEVFPGKVSTREVWREGVFHVEK